MNGRYCTEVVNTEFEYIQLFCCVLDFRFTEVQNTCWFAERNYLESVGNIHKDVEGTFNWTYSDVDSLVCSTKHDIIYFKITKYRTGWSMKINEIWYKTTIHINLCLGTNKDEVISVSYHWFLLH